MELEESIIAANKDRTNIIQDLISTGSEENPQNAVLLVGSSLDSRIYALDRVVLSLSSQKLRDLLTSRDDKNIYTISDVTPKEFDSMVQYMFLQSQWKFTCLLEACSLIEAARKYELHGLVDHVISQLLSLHTKGEAIFDDRLTALQSYTIFKTLDAENTILAKIAQKRMLKVDCELENQVEKNCFKINALKNDVEGLREQMGFLLKIIPDHKKSYKIATFYKSALHNMGVDRPGQEAITLFLRSGFLFGSVLVAITVLFSIINAVHYPGSAQQSSHCSKDNLDKCGDFIDHWKLFSKQSQSQAQDLMKFEHTGPLACAVLIRNTAPDTLANPSTYFWRKSHTEYIKMPVQVPEHTTASFGFTEEKNWQIDFRVLFSYRAGNATFIGMYSNEDKDKKFAIAFVLDENLSLHSGWARAIRNDNWDDLSGADKVYTSVKKGVEATVTLGKLHARATVTTGDKALFSILISEN